MTLLGTTSVQLSLDKTYLDAVRAYIRSIRTDFKALRNQRFTDVRNISEVEVMGVQTVQRLIYEAYPDPGTRTKALLHSIKAEDTSHKFAEISLYSDPQVATAKLIADLSYAAFFESPAEFDSFIKPRGQLAASNYRPFFHDWEQKLQRISLKQAEQATNETLEKLQPDIIKRT